MVTSNGGSFKLGRGEIAQRWMNALGHVLDLQPAANLDKGIIVVLIVGMIDMLLLEGARPEAPARSTRPFCVG